MSSRMPDGGYNPQFASTLLLDSFDFDMESGAGTENARKDPELPTSQTGLSGLPDGFVDPDEASEFDFRMGQFDEERGLGDLGGMVREASPRLVDLAWLEGVEPDPDRLPEAVNQVEYDLNDIYQTVVEDVPDTGTRSELEQAWGVDRRTNGQTIVPNVVWDPPKPGPGSGLPGNQLRDMVAHAMRKSAFGHSLETIVSEVAAHLGEGINHLQETADGRRFAAAMRSMRAEHGVHGKVYLRDSVFPGLLSGKWDSSIKKKCASAHYWLTQPGSKLAAYDNYLGKKVVTSIPWAEALEYYRPKLEASGKRVASGDPKQVLIAAIRAEAPVRQREAGVPFSSPVETVSSHQAWQVFSRMEAPKQEVVVRDVAAASLKKAQRQILRWVRANLLSQEDARRILSHKADPIDFVRAGAAIITASGKKATYEGHGVGATLPNQHPAKDGVWAELRAAALRKQAVESVKRVVGDYVRKGKLTASDREEILTSGLEPKAMLRLAFERAGEKRTAKAIVVSSSYGGAVFKENTSHPTKSAEWKAEQEAKLRKLAMKKADKQLARWVKAQLLSESDMRRIVAENSDPDDRLAAAAEAISAIGKKAAYEGQGVHAKVATPDKKVVQAQLPEKHRAVIRWASVQMNEGAAGRDLDYLLTTRFAENVLKEAGDSLTQLRKKHEGLAGHLYVDASVYASAAGMTGCEKGALVHRANAIPAVLMMERCGSCASNIESRCQKYNKALVMDPPVDDPVGYQREMIRLANASDAEHTASLFAPTFDPGEYGLENDSLEMFDYESAPSNPDLGDVLFDGWAIDTEE